MTPLVVGRTTEWLYKTVFVIYYTIATDRQGVMIFYTQS